MIPAVFVVTKDIFVEMFPVDIDSSCPLLVSSPLAPLHQVLPGRNLPNI